MPRLEFSSNNRAEQNESFPKLKLEQDEKGRIWCPENPIMEYVHNLRMPKIGPDGLAAYKTEKDKNGNEQQKQEFDFVGRPICLGDPSILEDNGLDPKNCPACREASKSDYVDKPVRRFAMHVVQYNTMPNGKMTTPFGGSVKIWSFTDFVFGKLVDLVDEYGPLRDLDLALTCKSKMFQQYDMIANPGKVWWKENDQTKALIEQIYAENQAKDLASYCGRKTKREFMEGDIAKIKQRYDQIMGRSAPAMAPEVDTPALSEGLEDLLGGSASKPAAKAEEKPAATNDSDAVDFNSLFG